MNIATDINLFTLIKPWVSFRKGVLYYFFLFFQITYYSKIQDYLQLRNKDSPLLLMHILKVIRK